MMLPTNWRWLLPLLFPKILLLPETWFRDTKALFEIWPATGSLVPRLDPLLQLCSSPSPVLWQVPHYFLFISILFLLLTVNLMVDLAVIPRLISRLIMIELKRLVIWLIWVWSHEISRWSLVWSHGDPIVAVGICFLFTFPQCISWLISRWSLDWSQDWSWLNSKD